MVRAQKYFLVINQVLALLGQQNNLSWSFGPVKYLSLTGPIGPAKKKLAFWAGLIS